MAVSNPMTTDNQYVKYTITVTQNSQSVANNTSNVTVSVRFYRTNTGYATYGTGTVYCKINGTTYSASVTPSDKITNSGIVLFSKTLNIPHNSDGSKSLTCSAWINHNSLMASEQSYTQTLTTIPRKSSITAVSGGPLGSQSTITVSQKSSSFTHSLKYTCGSASGYITSTGGNSSTESKYSTTSIKWTPPDALANQNTKGTSLTITLTLTTYSGSTKIGTSEWKSNGYYIPDSLVRPKPTLTVSDASGYASSYGGYVQGQSKLAVSVSASGLYGASIASYDIVVTQGKSKRVYTKSSFTTDVISSTDNIKIDVVVTDSRGVSSTANSVTKTVTVVPYTVPKFTSVTAKRCDYGGVKNGGLSIKLSASIVSLSGKNTAAYSVQYKKVSETTYCDPIALTDIQSEYDPSDYSYSFAADANSSYNIMLTARDVFGAITKTVNGSAAKKVWSIFSKGQGLALGKIAELKDVFDVAWKSIFRGDVCIGNKTGHLDGKTGLYVNKDGYMHLQRSTGEGYHPYFGFFLDDSTEVNGQIRLNCNTQQMEFLNAKGYKFGNTIHGASNLTLGEKTGDKDGKTGVYLDADGYIHIQRDNSIGQPKVGFYVKDSTSPGAEIAYNGTDDYLLFSGSTSYLFHSHIHTKESIKLGYEQTANKSHYIGAYWADGAHHYLVERGSNGLTASFGWAGTTDHATITRIRGRTCEYQNSSGTTTLSDERLKTDFAPLDKWDKFFNKLEPCAFKMKAGTSGRYHLGFKAQQVEQALTDSGLTTKDFAGFIKMQYEVDVDDPERSAVYEAAGIKAGDDEYGLIYSEFTALNTYKIQQLQKENDNLRERVAALESRMADIEALLNTREERE